MAKDIIKTIKLNTVKVIRQSKENPYIRGLVMKRNLTVREACHVYRNIFLFDLDLSLADFETKDERDYFYKDITNTLNNYIKGEVGYRDLCDVTYCYDDDNDISSISIGAHIKLVEYLQKVGVI